MKIYTKTGDKGETGIIGKRLRKNSKVIEAIGSLDELNASLGVCTSILSASIKKEMEQSNPRNSLVNHLIDIQSTIFSIGGILANGKNTLDFDNKTLELEKEIDRLDIELDVLENFILPGGSILSSNLHLSRTICRRSERQLVDLVGSENNNQEILEDILKYINRLSDYLFTAARWNNKVEGFEETKWEGN